MDLRTQLQYTSLTCLGSTAYHTMSVILAQIDIKVVDSATTLLSLLDNLASLTAGPLLLYLDLEGVELGRHGSISIISLHIASHKEAVPHRYSPSREDRLINQK